MLIFTLALLATQAFASSSSVFTCFPHPGENRLQAEKAVLDVSNADPNVFLTLQFLPASGRPALEDNMTYDARFYDAHALGQFEISGYSGISILLLKENGQWNAHFRDRQGLKATMGCEMRTVRW